MTNPAEAELARLEPKTLAGKLRKLMPLIDQKRREGVGYDEIMRALRSSGIDGKVETIQRYLRLYRKGLKPGMAQPPKPEPALPTTQEAARQPNDGGTRAIRNMINEEVDLDQWTRTAREAKRKNKP